MRWPRPPQGVHPHTADDAAAEIDAEQAEHDRQQKWDALGGGGGRLALGDACGFVFDEDRNDDIVDEDAVELGRQQANGRQHNRQRETRSVLGFYRA